MPSTIIATGVFDTLGNEKDSVVLTGWVFNQVLDARKVESAYHKLVETWPILSARLRRRDKKWVYELPQKFSQSTPQYVFKTKVIKGPIGATYNFPKPTKTIHCAIKENPDQLYSEGGPRSLGDYEKRDIPVSLLQLTQFDDACLLGLTTPHVLCDGYGNREIIYALARILRGEDVPPIQPGGDPFERFITKEPPLEAPPGWRAFSPWQMVIAVARLLWDLIKTRDITNRDIYFPKSEIEAIKAEAMADLKKEYGENPDIWISSSDALVAFCLKCIHPPTTSSQPFNVVYPANLRHYMSEILPKPFLHNAVFNIVTPTLPLSAISSLPLGTLALHIRKTVQTQTEKEAIKSCLQWRIANPMAFFFEPHGAWNVVTNWRDMKLMDVDFSAGLPDSALANQKKVDCLYLWAHYLIQPFPLRHMIGLIADDPSGGVWIGGYLSEHVWKRPGGFGRFIKD